MTPLPSITEIVNTFTRGLVDPLTAYVDESLIFCVKGQNLTAEYLNQQAIEARVGDTNLLPPYPEFEYDEEHDLFFFETRAVTSDLFNKTVIFSINGLTVHFNIVS